MADGQEQLELDEFEKSFSEFAKAKDGEAVQAGGEEPPKKEEPPKEEVKTEDAAAKEAAAKEAEAKAAAAKEAAKEPKGKKQDPEWMASLPAEAQDFIKGLRNDVSREQGRTRAARDKIKELEDAKAPPKKEEAPTDFRQSESWTQLAKAFPEIAAGVETALAGVVKDVQSVKEVAGSLAKDRDETASTKAKQAVAVKYEGWEEAVQSPDFEKWFGEQSPGVQALAASADPRDALLMLDRYATDTGNISARKDKEEPPKKEDLKAAGDEAAKAKAEDEKARLAEKRKQQLQDAAGPTGSSPGSGERATVPDDFEAAFAVFAKKKDDQLAAMGR